MGLTVEPDGQEGAFLLREDDGTVSGHGMARISKARPGYLTLVSAGAPLGYALRVPISWIPELARQGLSDHDV